MNIRQQAGFTLIELMIVVAIIGILAAIAVPAYQDYLARAQASEALTSTAGLRSEVSVYLSENGDLTGVDSDAVISTTAGELGGEYFSESGVSVGENGVISVVYDDGVHSGSTITLTPTLNTAGTQVATWVCDGIDDKYLPSACRPEAAAGG